MQSTKRGDGRNDTYLRLPEMAPAEEENASLLASGKRRSLGSVDAIALKLLASRRRASVDGTSNDIPDERVARGALIAARRWKSTTKRVTNMRRMRDAIDEVLERHNPGAAPGIDPRRSKYHHLASKWCLPARITVVDYCAKDITIHSGLDGAGDLSAFLSQPREDNGHVRWIHVDGLNWDVVQVLALKFDLHPLALEDTVHVPQRIKADFYDSCLYVALIYLYLAGGNGSSGTDDTITDPATSGNGVADGGVQQPASDSTSSRSLPRTISIVTKTDSAAAAAAVSSRPASRHGSANLGGGSAAAATVTPRQLDLEDDGGFFECRQSRTLNAGPTHWPLPLRHGSVCMAPRQPVGGCGGATGGGDHGASSAQEPSGGGAVSIHVSAQQVSLFLLRGEHPNVLITIFQSDGSKVTDPILEQLKEPRTLVREAEDASFLANLVIDTLVDHIFPVVSAYREQLQQYEMDVTGSGPSAAASTRELHAMQRDLRRIDRTIAPLQAVVANMVVRDSTPVSGATSVTAANGATNGIAASPSVPASAPQPFLSRLTCTYLNDVRDHVATICEDLLSLSAECGDLIGLIFNLTTLQQSQSTQTLAVVSTIFLPITFLAGVYGMNFDTLPELHWSYGYLYFWLASLLIVIVFMVVMQRAGMWSLSGTSW